MIRAVFFLLLLVSAVYGQTPGSFVTGQTLPAAGLNAAFALKQDYLGINVVTPEKFGAGGKCLTDDTTAVQAAINYIQTNSYSGTLQVSGCYNLSDTVTINQASVAVLGYGWGTAVLEGVTLPIPSTVFQWTGVAGKPMFLSKDNWGTSFRHLRIIGSSVMANAPTAIEINQSAGLPMTQQKQYIEDVWIGGFYGLESPTLSYIDTCVRLTGNQNGDTNSIKDFTCAAPLSRGISNENNNAGQQEWFNVWIGQAPVGLYTAGPITIHGLAIHGSSTADIQLDTPGGVGQGLVHVNGYVSESSARMAQFLGDHQNMQLIIKEGTWQATSFMCNDGGGVCNVIDTGTAYGVVDLENFTFTSNSAPRTPVIKAFIAAGASRMTVRVVCGGVNPSNINVGPYFAGGGSVNDQRAVIFEPCPLFAPGVAVPDDSVTLNWPQSDDRNYQSWRRDTLGKGNVFGGPLNVRQLPAPSGFCSPVGAGATTYTYRWVALTYDGGKSPSATFTCTNGAIGSGGRTNYIAVSSQQAIGAYAYALYSDGGLGGALGLITTQTWEQLMINGGFLFSPGGMSGYADNGGALGAAPPTVNSTGNVDIDGMIISGSGTSASKPVLSGSCVVVAGTQKGGLLAGEFAVPAGNCNTTTTVTMTFPLAAPNGYTCDAHNVTTPTSIWDQTGVASETMTATFTIRSANSTAADVVKFKCLAY